MITDSFNRSRAVICPEHIAAKDIKVPEVFISSFSSGFTRILKEKYDAEEIGRIYLSGRIPIYRIEYGGKSIGYFESPVGAPAAVFTEEMFFEMGAEKILYFGSCGYLDSDMSSELIFIPESAYRDEGTSYHYMPASDYINIATAGKLKEIFERLGIPYVSGKTWTTDAFFRETEISVSKRKKEGCLTVEMECSALMAAADFRDKETYQFLFTADCLDGDYSIGTLGKTEERLLEISLEAAKEL